MLSLFPQILFLAPLSATLLRIAVGLVFLYLAYFHWSDRQAVAQELSTFVGAAGIICVLYALLELLVAASLIAGFWMQLGALVGFVLAIKMMIIRKSMQEMKPLSQLSYALVAIICLSLLFTGAGIFAFDLPL